MNTEVFTASTVKDTAQDISYTLCIDFIWLANIIKNFKAF